LDPVFRQDVQLLQLIQARAQLGIAKSWGLLPVGYVVHCLKNISRQIVFAAKLLEFGKFTFQTADLGPTLHSEIHQRADQEITLSPEPLLFAFVGYPLVAEDL